MIENFFAIGFNHHQSDASVRSRFALSNQRSEQLFEKASGTGLDSLIILNTCNRTELYGSGRIEEAEKLYFETIEGTLSGTDTMMRKEGQVAVRHIFRVAAGLDSQITGDLEILGQFKQAFLKSKELGMADGITERLFNNSLRAAKEIRRDTRISYGTVSLSYAAVQRIREQYAGRPCKVLILGAGKFGSSIAKNLHDYYPAAALSICNRTWATAAWLAAQVGGSIVESGDVTALNEADVIISTVDDNAGYVLNTTNVFPSERPCLLIDMSIPLSIAPELGRMPSKKLITLDEIGSVVGNTLELRNADIPIAEGIIERHVEALSAWFNRHEKAHPIREWKKHVLELTAACPVISRLPEPERKKIVRRSIAAFAAAMQKHPDGDSTIEELIDRFMRDHSDLLYAARS